MRVLPKQIWKEKFEYYSDKPLDDIRAEIKNTLDKSRGFSLNMVGEFISYNEFKIYA